MVIILGIENPASKAIYEQANEKANKTSEMYCFAIVKVTPPSVILPRLILNIYHYFTMDDASNIYRLPFPMWYVSI